MNRPRRPLLCLALAFVIHLLTVVIAVAAFSVKQLQFPGQPKPTSLFGSGTSKDGVGSRRQSHIHAPFLTIGHGVGVGVGVGRTTSTSTPRKPLKYRQSDESEEEFKAESGVNIQSRFTSLNSTFGIRSKYSSVRLQHSIVTDEEPSSSSLTGRQGRVLKQKSAQPMFESNASAHLTTIPKSKAAAPRLPEKDDNLLLSTSATGSSPSRIEYKYTSRQPTSKTTMKTAPHVVSNVHALRQKVLDEGKMLRDLKINMDFGANTGNATTAYANTSANRYLLNHTVVQILAERFRTSSKPGSRAKHDTARVALAIEGGGLRGAVCSGMAAAIASLGLTDSFDTILGSSAGSVIGAYMVSRQICVEVYLDILPAAKRTFVCPTRIVQSLVATAFDHAVALHVPPSFAEKWPKLRAYVPPGMNLSFVLDGIMDETHGLRPLDMESFRQNDRQQPLRVVTSYVHNGKLRTKCFGTHEFFHEIDSGVNATMARRSSVVRRSDGKRHGLYASLEASMSVPGASGDPIRLTVDDESESIPFFDAFCFEPLPYRSAVEEGATHVLVLCSRPDGFQPKTVPGIYERGVANLYFTSHGEPSVASFFEQGGQQYIYAEDLLTLEEGKHAGLRRHNDKESPSGVLVPPTQVLYGVERDACTDYLVSHRDKWKRAHLLPLKVPVGTKELPTLEQERDSIGTAVREGFAAAFDLLAPAIGLQLRDGLTGIDVANLVFPSDAKVDDHVLELQLRIKGDSIFEAKELSSSLPFVERNSGHCTTGRTTSRSSEVPDAATALKQSHFGTWHLPHNARQGHAEHLLNVLPGFACGRMDHLAERLRTCIA